MSASTESISARTDATVIAGLPVPAVRHSRPDPTRLRPSTRILTDSPVPAGPHPDHLIARPYRLRSRGRVRRGPKTPIRRDNRFLQHCGVQDAENERRHLVGTIVTGERPV